MIRRTAALAAAVTATLLSVAAPAQADATRNAQWYLSALGVTQAWHTSEGAGVTVCVIDSGIVTSTPDLQGAVVGRKTFEKYVDPATDAVSPHGTGVAAVLGGRGHGGSDGTIGVAPKVRLLDAVVNDGDAADFPRQLPLAIRWCTDKGAKIITMSVIAPAAGTIVPAIQYAQSKDVVVVAASSNTFDPVAENTLPYPSVVPGVVAVTGVDKGLKHDPGAFISNTGKAVSLAAPFSTTDCTTGNPVVGLTVPSPTVYGQVTGPYTTKACGTSYSAPIVAGIAALIRSAHPNLDADDVINTLIETATPAGAGHPNRTFGYGIVNAARAVTASLPRVQANPLIDAGAARNSAPSSTHASSPVASSSRPQRVDRSAASATGDHGSFPTVSVTAAAAAVLVVVTGGFLLARTRRRR